MLLQLVRIQLVRQLQWVLQVLLQRMLLQLVPLRPPLMQAAQPPFVPPRTRQDEPAARP